MTDSQTIDSVVDCWTDVLGHDDFGVDDDFFAVGGDSLKAVVLVRQLRSAGHRCDLATLLQAPTVNGVVASLAQESRVSRPPIEHQPR